MWKNTWCIYQKLFNSHKKIYKNEVDAVIIIYVSNGSDLHFKIKICRSEKKNTEKGMAFLCISVYIMCDCENGAVEPIKYSIFLL